jgi:cell division protein FtsA
MGGDTTKVAFFLEGVLLHVDTIPMGSHHVTNDIARALSVSLHEAERLKTLYGTLCGEGREGQERITVRSLGEDDEPLQVPKKLLSQIVEARVEETVDFIYPRFKRSPQVQLASQRIVLTGGGSQLSGMRDFLSSRWKRKVRIGLPKGVFGPHDLIQSPLFSTGAGLLHFSDRDHPTVNVPTLPNFQGLLNWLRENF